MRLSEFLQAHPEFDADAGIELGKLAEQVMHLDRTASLTVAIGMEKKGGRLMTQIKHSAKPPKPDPEAGLFFVKDGELTKDDPWQMSIDDFATTNEETD
jgi:hypothetical protein